MSHLNDTVIACAYLLDKAAAHNFKVDTMGSAHGGSSLNHRAKRPMRKRSQILKRRREIIALLRKGELSQVEIAERMCCGKSAVNNVAKLLRQGKL